MKNKFRVLTYHEVNDPINFRVQMLYLKNEWNPTSIKSLEMSLLAKDELTDKAVLLTFDDADESVYRNGLPILKELKIPFTVFVITSLIGTDKPFWWDQAAYLDLDVRKLKEMKNSERLIIIEEAIRISRKDEIRKTQLNLKQLEEIEMAGGTIACHTHSHPMLNQCDYKTIENEIVDCRKILQKNNFAGFRYFAYPNGSLSKKAEKILKQNGFKLAFLFNHQLSSSLEHPLRLSRLSVNSNTKIFKYKFILSGWHSKLLPIKKLFI